MKQLDIKQDTNLIKNISFAFLSILLVIRLSYDSFAALIWHPAPPNYNEIPAWYFYLFIFVSYLFITVVIWLNRNNLQGLNIDQPFMIIFVSTAILASLYYLPPFLGVLLGIVTVITIRMLLSKKITVERLKLDAWKVIPIFVIGIVPFLLLFVIMRPIMGNTYSIGTALFLVSLPTVVMEEFIFRGLLWLYLKNNKLTDAKIVYVQAFLFWLSHLAQNWSHPFMLWFWTVWVALWLGILVRRSKSLTPSVIGHFLANLLSILIYR